MGSKIISNDIWNDSYHFFHVNSNFKDKTR